LGSGLAFDRSNAIDRWRTEDTVAVRDLTPNLVPAGLAVVGYADGHLPSLIPADKTATQMNDILLSLAEIGRVYGLLEMAAWITYVMSTWISNLIYHGSWRTASSQALEANLSSAPWRTVDPDSASYQMALDEWGTKIINTGDEVSMCAFELLFRIDPPVAGVSEVTTIEGEALFTPGRRCMVIIDKNQITVFDRIKQHGVQLGSDHSAIGPVVRRTTLQGSTLTTLILIRTQYSGTRRRDRYFEEIYSVDLHAEHASDLVPPGWPGKAVLLPQPAAAPAANELR
jgi:hypothetical protein